MEAIFPVISGLLERDGRFTRWLEVEAALASAQAQLGIIPQKAAEDISSAAHMDKLDLSRYDALYAKTGHPMVAMLRLLEEAAGPESGQYIHLGATTQDVMDTALISAPRCFEIERKLKECCDIPIFHDDQHGTAVITLAGLTNALKVVGKKKEDIKVVMNGAGAAAIAIAKLLLAAGVKDVTLCDRNGAIYEGREKGMNPIKNEMAKITNLAKKQGTLADMLVGADVFIGVSAPGAVTTEMVKTMNKDAIIFACANPTPEIFPDDARAGGAAVIATGRSDFPNQINNVLAFPGIFRGAFDVRARDINEAMKVAAAEALAGLISDEELSADYIIPAAFDPRVGKAVAAAVAQAAWDSGVARI